MPCGVIQEVQIDLSASVCRINMKTINWKYELCSDDFHDLLQSNRKCIVLVVFVTDVTNRRPARDQVGFVLCLALMYT
jgi:hypothetical protein